MSAHDVVWRWVDVKTLKRRRNNTVFTSCADWMRLPPFVSYTHSIYTFLYTCNSRVPDKRPRLLANSPFLKIVIKNPNSTRCVSLKQ